MLRLRSLAFLRKFVYWKSATSFQLNADCEHRSRKETQMRHGFVIPVGDVLEIVDLTIEAEAAGWDAAFIADAIDIGMGKGPPMPWFDPWVALGAMAMRTERIRIGTMIAAVPRRRPWKLAREAATIDHLSAGRLTL